MPKLFLQTIQFMLNPCFSSGNLKFWYMLRRGCLYDQTPTKTVTAESLMILRGWQHFICVITCGALRIPCVTQLGWNPWKPEYVFPWILPYVPLPFPDFAFYPFALTKHSSKTICQVLWVLLLNHQIQGGGLVYP